MNFKTRSLLAPLLALAILPASAIGAQAVTPHFSTGGVAHVLGTTGQLEGTVNTEGLATSFFFEYGPTVAYGTKTKPVAVPIPSPLKPVKVGQAVTGLLPGYHYRIVGIYPGPSGPLNSNGNDKSFSGGKASRTKFDLPKGKEGQISTVYGGTAILTGSLGGLNGAGQPLSLQATPFPYTDPFTTLGGTVITSRTSSFVFKIAKLTQNTELRVLTVAPRPVYSPVIVVHVTPRITLHVRSAGHTGLYRLYGTVAPARKGASLQIQQLLPQKANSKREGPAPHSVGNTTLKRATSSLSRFSIVVSLSGNFRYRAYVKLPKGSLDSGHSSNVLIKAPKSSSTKHHGK
ncbi:MAG TPA: hypothetical protein VH061_11555 [Solirubrobacteraceae bacterium]|jgi:hypothetical protein|nr:hypothetical protein [Solirubrobacteraceae bacterium]